MGRSVDTRSLQHYLGHKNIQHTVRYPKEVPPCLTGTVSKICWRFCTGTLQRRLMRSHSIAGALSMASCQWDSKSTVWATGVSFLPWWKVLAELKKFSMSTTTNTPTPRCVLCCPRWGAPVFSNPEIQIQVCSPGRLDPHRSALLAIGFYLGSDTLRRYTLGDFATSFAKHQRYPRGRRLVLYDAEGDFDRNFDWWKESCKHRLV